MDRSKITIGPMIGHTSHNKARLWLRAGDKLLGIGKKVIVKLFTVDEDSFTEEKEFNFISDYDHVGLIEFGSNTPLQPDTEYKYSVYISYSDDRIELFKEGVFKTFSENPHKEVSFITGSCRHLYVSKNTDLLDDDMTDNSNSVHYGDQAFKSISEAANLNPDFMIMSGDQVYCDHDEGSPFSFKPAKKLPEYLDNYYRAYSQPYFSGLAMKIPIYMAMDDHEIKNDWRMDKIYKENDKNYKDNLEHYRNGLKSYSIYQAALSSVIKDTNNLKEELGVVNNTEYEEGLGLDAEPYKNKTKGLFYTFEHGPARIFSMDVRLERYMHRTPAQMLGAYQEEALKTWLLKHGSDDFVKFVVSAVPVFPDTKNVFFYPVGAPEDKWAGYAEQRLRILDFIRTNNIKKVVFISGDVHVSLAAKLQYKGEDIGVYSIVSSGFTWPVPGLQRFNFDWKALPEKSKFKNSKRIPDTNTRGDYRAKKLTRWKFLKTGHREHNYCYLKTDGKKLVVQYYKSRSGKKFEDFEIRL